jgi:pantothenate synthetase
MIQCELLFAPHLQEIPPHNIGSHSLCKTETAQIGSTIEAKANEGATGGIGRVRGKNIQIP